MKLLPWWSTLFRLAFLSFEIGLESSDWLFEDVIVSLIIKGFIWTFLGISLIYLDSSGWEIFVINSESLLSPTIEWGIWDYSR